MTTEQTELGRFLRTRRAGVRPADVGLPAGTGTRRTPGLRREELATLAGVSIDYYTRLERGKETRPSPAVVDALARVLLLDEEEHEFLRALAAQAARRAPVPPPAASRLVRPTVQLLLEAVRPNPAYVLSRTNDLLDANPAGFQLLPGLADWPARQRNTIRYTFLHPAARDLWPDWEQKARGCVAHLHAVAGADPDAPDLAGIIGELIVKSPDFSRLWDRYEVRRMGDGEKVFRHPAVGTMTLAHESLELTRTDGQRLVIYMAAPATPDYDATVLLDLTGSATTTPESTHRPALTRPPSPSLNPARPSSPVRPRPLASQPSHSIASITPIGMMLRLSWWIFPLRSIWATPVARMLHRRKMLHEIGTGGTSAPHGPIGPASAAALPAGASGSRRLRLAIRHRMVNPIRLRIDPTEDEPSRATAIAVHEQRGDR